MKSKLIAWLLLGILCLSSVTFAFTENLSATVNTKNDPLNLWNAPDGSTCFVRIPKGETITILEKGDKWSKAEYDGKTGYVRTEFLLFLEQGASLSENGKATANYDTLNLWNTQDGDTALARIPEGDTIIILEKGDKWSKAEFDGKTGYVRTMFLLFEGEDESLTNNKKATIDDAIERLYAERREVWADWDGESTSTETREKLKEIDNQIVSLEAMKKLTEVDWVGEDGNLTSEAAQSLNALEAGMDVSFVVPKK